MSKVESLQYRLLYDAAGRRVGYDKSGSAFATPDTYAYLYNARSELTNATAAVDSACRYGYDFDDIGNQRSSLERRVQSVEYTEISHPLFNLHPSWRSVAETEPPTFNLNTTTETRRSSRPQPALKIDCSEAVRNGEVFYMLSEADRDKLENEAHSNTGAHKLAYDRYYESYKEKLKCGITIKIVKE